MMRDKKKKTKAPKLKTFACIRMMNADNPVSFIGTPLYVLPVAVFCHYGPAVVHFLFVRQEDRLDCVHIREIVCCCFVFVFLLRGPFTPPSKPLTSRRPSVPEAQGFRLLARPSFTVGFAESHGGLCDTNCHRSWG